MSLVKRTRTALILIAVLFVVIQYAPQWAWLIFAQAFILAAILEFYALAARRGLYPKRELGVLLALAVGAGFFLPGVPVEVMLFAVLLVSACYFVFSTDTLEKLPHFTASFAITIIGIFYISFPLNYLYLIRRDFGPYHLYFLFSVIFLGDTGAYMIGKPFGRHKMTPIASPNKTWEGSLAGIVFACAGALLAWFVLGRFSPDIAAVPALKAVLTGFAVHAAAQISDPLESLFKRAVGVKDSSNALPGHGGFLDRIDSLILAGPLFYFLARYFWKQPLG
jgi:phosphatidate cytidylyltransferase